MNWFVYAIKSISLVPKKYDLKIISTTKLLRWELQKSLLGQKKEKLKFYRKCKIYLVVTELFCWEHQNYLKCICFRGLQTRTVSISSLFDSSIKA